jgi:hypothetical protein
MSPGRGRMPERAPGTGVPMRPGTFPRRRNGPWFVPYALPASKRRPAFRAGHAGATGGGAEQLRGPPQGQRFLGAGSAPMCSLSTAKSSCDTFPWNTHHAGSCTAG